MSTLKERVRKADEAADSRGEKLDVRALHDRTMRRFPKTMARLAE